MVHKIPNLVKDPLYPQSNLKLLNKLEILEHFKTEYWQSIRFSETQNNYLSTLGFIELKPNEELRRFEPHKNEDYHLCLLQRSFAAMTHVMLFQRVELQNTLQNLINWSGDKETNLTPSLLFKKLRNYLTRILNL